MKVFPSTTVQPTRACSSENSSNQKDSTSTSRLGDLELFLSLPERWGLRISPFAGTSGLSKSVLRMAGGLCGGVDGTGTVTPLSGPVGVDGDCCSGDGGNSDLSSSSKRSGDGAPISDSGCLSGVNGDSASVLWGDVGGLSGGGGIGGGTGGGMS